MNQRTLPIVLTGLVAGVGSGMLGVGGGVIMVPLLVTVVGLSQHHAHATSLAAIAPIAAAGVIPYAIDSSVDYGIAALLVAGSLVGAPLGARAMVRLAEGPLKVLFGAFLIVLAVVMATT